ncbi:MAG: hypothetical protein JWN44_2217 [Myxococcales bacterium]|nr:hypothetical protein [Myxococcales bacterium]
MLALVLVAGCGPTAPPTEPAVDGGTSSGGDMGCSTACDCPTGETCASGTCIDGLVEVYCCSDEECPPQQICQSPSGEVSLCGGLGDPP